MQSSIPEYDDSLFSLIKLFRESNALPDKLFDTLEEMLAETALSDEVLEKVKSGIYVLMHLYRFYGDENQSLFDQYSKTIVGQIRRLVMESNLRLSLGTEYLDLDTRFLNIVTRYFNTVGDIFNTLEKNPELFLSFRSGGPALVFNVLIALHKAKFITIEEVEALFKKVMNNRKGDIKVFVRSYTKRDILLIYLPGLVSRYLE